jgi:predicted ATP-grasp superfamily ATP-dependent carboligase
MGESVVPDRTALPVALVIGGGAIEVVRSLQIAGLPCAVVTTPGDATKYSSGIDSVFHWDWSQPLEAHDEALADRLVAWAHTQPEPPVLFYSSDQALLFVSRQRDRLAHGFRFAIPDAELVEAMADKGLFSTLAERLALPVPATIVLPPGLGAEPPDLTELGFPLIIKPERRDRGWRHVCDGEGVKVKALVIESERQLREVWPELAAMGRTLVAQQYVKGPESAIESYHVYSDKTGEIVAEFTGRKIRTYPVECGFTTALSVTREPDVLYAGRKLVELLDLRGVAKFDFKRAPDGQLYLFEINARTSLWMHPGARAGVNICEAVYADLTGRPRPALASDPLPVSWVHPKDVLAARASGLPMSRWLRFAASCQAKAFWYWRDPMPFVGMAVSRARSGNFT